MSAALRKQDEKMTPTEHNDPTAGPYQVVALKYRPQSFGDLVGQDHIATALSNAIIKNRVGHAYLFTGARGVGKTSSARIFAKCLNCQNGPTTTPCNECDICESVSTGEDVDVLEIDGASNRGIDEIRQLRSNAAVRPSRSRFKIYIIDEVHMLTQQAFNALLKTLEEPPLHVKFIFCTTDPQKIPITVLSRCQRFDFSPVQTNEIANRLREIADKEGVAADEAALSLLARRANGSMRDSQSLLEQLFSFCGKKITVDEVNQLLGTADIGRIGEIATAMANYDAAGTLNLINQANVEGVDPGQLARQLLGYFRDVMAVRVGCGEDTLLTCSAADVPALNEVSEQYGLETILSIIQILDGAVVRMQSSLHARTLLEVAAIRICNLENLDSISDLISQLADGGTKVPVTNRPSVRPTAKKKVELKQVSAAKSSKKNEIAEESGAAPTALGASAEPTPVSATHSLGAGSESLDESRFGSVGATATLTKPKVTKTASADSSVNLTAAEIETYWTRTLEALGDMTADMAGEYEALDVAEDKLVVTLRDAYHARECSKPERKQKIESTLKEITGRQLKVDFQASKKTAEARKSDKPKLTRTQQIRKLHEDEFVKQTISLFDAEITDFYETGNKKRD
jgi:DNA polymerase-3 subunit gamma/tau